MIAVLKSSVLVLVLAVLVLEPIQSVATGNDDLPSSGVAQTVRFDPVVKDIEGWTVHVDPQLLEGSYADQGKRELTMLANHLQRIKIVLPPKAVGKLQQVEIWIERQHPAAKAMCYHPSEGWLIQHDYDPRLAKKVHIVKSSELLSRQQMLKHPAVVLHELAHAYHDQVLGFGNEEVIKVFKAAKKSGNYETVLDHRGIKVRHYGLNNHKEYFAEGTEAFFYRNDFYPFVRGELKEHDPALEALLKKVWGVRK